MIKFDADAWVKMWALIFGFLVVGFFFSRGFIQEQIDNKPPQILELRPENGTIYPGTEIQILAVTSDDRDVPVDMHFTWQVSEGTLTATEKPYIVSYRAPLSGGSYYVLIKVTVADRFWARSSATTRILISDTDIRR